MKKFGMYLALLGVFSYIAFSSTLQAEESLSISGVSVRASTCGNKKAGSISFQIQGGQAPYTVQLFNNTDPFNAVGTKSNFSGVMGSFSNLVNGTYFLTVTAVNTSTDKSSDIVVKNSCTPLLLCCCR